MLSWNRLVADAGLQLAFFTGVAKIAERRKGGAGVILKFEHVRPPRAGAFQPLRSREITAEFLDKAIRAMRRWRYDFLSMDEVRSRAQQSALAQRFVCLTFDGGHRDFMNYAYPVLSRHRVPFTLYLPTGFVDGIGEAWWLALEDIIARNPRIGLMIDDVEKRFATGTLDEKYEVYGLLYDWLGSLPPADLSAAIGDLCTRYGTDLKAMSRAGAMTWPDLAKLARDPQATIGSATVHYPALSRAKGNVALREMTMGRSVLETALGSTCRHFAYPFGNSDSFGPRDVMLAKEAGFFTAVSAQPGVVRADGKSDLFSLPRVAWDGRRKSIASLRAVLSGIGLRREQDVPQTTDAENYV